MIVLALEYGTMTMGLFGGLAIFLFGMGLMTDALKTVAGKSMKKLLARLTTNRFKAVFAGGIVTAVIQSSSVTTVLTVGFVSAGLMTLQQSIGIIMGAEIGTTVTAQIIAFKVTKIALGFVTIGFALQFFFKSEKVREYGTMILGFGLLFVGMNLMQAAMEPLRDHEPFLELMKQMETPLLAILVSALFTGLVQSSSATTGVILALAASGLISLEAGIALVFGANIGTCVTALLASIGRPRVAVQTAMIHVTFNVAGVLLWLGFIPLLADAVRDLSGNVTRQIANAHTMFNVTNTLVFIGFAPLFARLVQWIVPLRPEPEDLGVPKYLDDNLIETPELALDRVHLEIGRVGEMALKIIRRAPDVALVGTRDELKRLALQDDDVDALHLAIISYLGHLAQGGLTLSQTETFHDDMAIVNYLENMADVAETRMVPAGLHRLDRGVVVSDKTRERIERLARVVTSTVEQTLEAVRTSDRELAREVISAKEEIAAATAATHWHLAERLAADEPQRGAAYAIESELVESLKRIYYNTKRIAKVIAQVDMEYLREKEESEADA